MIKQELGKTGIEISPIGMGTIQMTRLPWQESLHVIRGVFDVGINWFDTAQGYLDAELRLGEALEDVRHQAVFITKSGASDSGALSEHIEASLNRLRTDYIDVFFFHGGSVVMQDGFDAPGGVLETACRYVDQGKIRHLGFSAHRPETALRALDFPELEVSMVPANFINREYIDGPFMSKARERGVAVLAMKPYGGGRIVKVEPCLHFLKNYPDLIPCIGVDSVAQMEENISVWESDSEYSRTDQAVLEEQKTLLGDHFCRLCGYCLPCPEDIPIPTVNFLKVFSMQMPRERVVTDKHAEAVDKAKGCTECRQCVEKCPYDLEIPSMLKENIEFYQDFAKA